MKIYGFIFSSLLLTSASFATYTVPANNQVYKTYGKAESKQAVDRPLRILLWNIQKETQQEVWQKDFLKLSQYADVSMIQEYEDLPIFRETLKALPGFLFDMFAAFAHNGFEAGVMLASRIQQINSGWLRSSVQEPFSNTPKMIGWMDLPWKNGQSLKVVTIHAMNFNVFFDFKTHVDQLYDLVRDYKGPLVIAGDFNTWSPMRQNYLNYIRAKLGMQEAGFPTDPRVLKLDHAFYRGVDLKKAYLLSAVTSSDHYPIWFEIN